MATDVGRLYGASMHWRVITRGSDHDADRVHDSAASAWRDFDWRLAELKLEGLSAREEFVEYGRRWQQEFSNGERAATVSMLVED
jgi:hypothetical protein